MIEVVKEQITTEGCEGRVQARVMDACALDFEGGRFDLSITNFGISLFPDAVKGVKEIFRTLKVGGIAIVTTWKAVGWLPLLHELQKVLRPGEEPFSLGKTAEWEEKEKMVGVLGDAAAAGRGPGRPGRRND